VNIALLPTQVEYIMMKTIKVFLQNFCVKILFNTMEEVTATTNFSIISEYVCIFFKSKSYFDMIEIDHTV